MAIDLANWVRIANFKIAINNCLEHVIWGGGRDRPVKSSPNDEIAKFAVRQQKPLYGNLDHNKNSYQQVKKEVFFKKNKIDNYYCSCVHLTYTVADVLWICKKPLPRPGNQRARDPATPRVNLLRSLAA